MKRMNQSGFSHLVLFLLVAGVLGMSLVAYRAVSSNRPASDGTASSSQLPAALKTTADINTASKVLDATNENDVNPDQLDADLNALL